MLTRSSWEIHGTESQVQPVCGTNEIRISQAANWSIEIVTTRIEKQRLEFEYGVQGGEDP